MTIDSVVKKIRKKNGHNGMTEQKQDSYDAMTLV